MRCCGRAQQLAVEAAAGCKQVSEGQRGEEAELKGCIAELEVEIEQAHLAPERRLVLGRPDSQLRQKSSGADSADALNNADDFAVGGVIGAGLALNLLPNGHQRGFEVGRIER